MTENAREDFMLVGNLVGYCKGIGLLLALLALGCSPEKAPVVVESPKLESRQPAVESRQAESKPLPVAADTPDLWTRGGDDWPGFLGISRDGKSAETGLNWDWSNSGLPLVWSRPIVGGYGIGSTSAGRFYQFDGDGRHARLVCLNAETGQLLWEFDYAMAYKDRYGFDNGPRCSPIVDGGRVYIYGVEGMLHCLNALTGEKIWDVDTATKYGVVTNFFGVGSSPIVYDDLLIVMVGGSTADTAELPSNLMDNVEPNGCAIVAFDKLTGEERYRTGNDLASYASPVVATIQDKPTGLAFCRSGLLAFDPKSGAEAWSFPWRARKFESANASSPVVSGDRVLITESYGPGGVLLDLSGEQPIPIWQDENIRKQRLSCHWCTPVIVDGFAYACHGEKINDAELRCVELATGAVKWKETQFGRCTLTYVDGHLVGLNDYGLMFVIRADPERVQLVAQYEPSDRNQAFAGPCYAAPIISRSLLFVRDARRLYCFELRKP